MITNMNKKELYTLLSQIETSYKIILKEKSLNGLSPNLYMQNRIVLEIDDKIYRIATPREIKNRILTQEWLRSQKIDIMLMDHWEPSMSGKIFGVSSQEKIRIDPPKSNALLTEFFNKNPEILKLFNQYGIIWYNENNSGINSSNQVKILDWASNLTVSQNNLIDKNGQVLWSRDFKEEL